MKSIILILLGSAFSLSCFSQLDSNVIVNGIERDRLYAGKSNLIVIEYKVDTFQNILVTSSQGEVSSIDKYLHYLNFNKKGEVRISVFNDAKTEKKLLSQATFIVDTFIPTKREQETQELTTICPISIEDFKGDKIPISLVKKATRFKICHSYRISSLTIYVDKHELWTWTLGSGEFDNTLLSVLQRVMPGTIITVDNILITDSKNRKHSILAKSFVVTDDN